MEPITLCGATIVMFGLWVEFESKLKAVTRAACNNSFFKEMFYQSPVQRPACARKMPICLAKGFH
jgi:hypothetical protein